MPTELERGRRATRERTCDGSLLPDRLVFVIVAFEGPDPYSQAGGLAVRVTELSRTLAEHGHETHLFFLGDPSLPGYETHVSGRLHLHRWARWLSAGFGRGVYDGEDAKANELASSLPAYVAEHVVRPAVAAGRVPVVLSEEWQTADFACRLSDHLHARGLRDRTLLLWNANNPYSFDRIDWARLAFTNALMAVSRYMRSIIRAQGVDAAVVPNGIPARLTAPPSDGGAEALREALGPTRLFFKMARWEREKGWTQALDALALLRGRGRRAVLVARSGGPSGPGSGLHAEASRRGLQVVELADPSNALSRIAESARATVDVVSLRFGVDESLARALYASADGVLANSISEPFGLVGLEAMAAGGVVFTGGTGEDYASAWRNAVVLESVDPEEIAHHSDRLADDQGLAARIRRAARRTALRYTWDRVSQLLLARVVDLARRQGMSMHSVPARTPTGNGFDLAASRTPAVWPSPHPSAAPSGREHGHRRGARRAAPLVPVGSEP